MCSYSDDNCKKLYKYWRNSNKLIDEKYRGIKTGITSTAGGCLACFWKSPSKSIILIVLGCSD